MLLGACAGQPGPTGHAARDLWHLAGHHHGLLSAATRHAVIGEDERPVVDDFRPYCRPARLANDEDVAVDRKGGR